MFAVKLNADVSQVIYGTYLGGSGDESFPSLAVDSAGSAFIVGSTRSADFPTANALQPDFEVAAAAVSIRTHSSRNSVRMDCCSSTRPTWADCTWDGAADVAVDASGNAYVVGSTDSGEFPRVGGIPRTNYSAYPEAYMTKINSTGSALLFSTTLGGSYSDGALRVALDATGNVWVAGFTSSEDFPVKSPVQAIFAGGWDDGFVAKFNPQGSSLLASTYLGGSGRDYISGLAIDAVGSLLVSGVTSSTDLRTLNPFQAALAATPDQQGSQGGQDAFLAKLTWESDPVLAANAGPDQLVAATESCRGEVTLDGTRSTAPPDRYIWAYLWSGTTTPLHAEGPTPTFDLPSLGTYTFDLTIFDDSWQWATDSVSVTLADLEPPRVGSVAATPSVLWPPNREMVPVAVTVADVSDACSRPVTCGIDSVTSNESLAPGDWVITGALTVQLRADRLGDGTGRIYTIAVTCTDAAGNSTRKTVAVLVPTTPERGGRSLIKPRLCVRPASTRKSCRRCSRDSPLSRFAIWWTTLAWQEGAKVGEPNTNRTQSRSQAEARPQHWHEGRLLPHLFHIGEPDQLRRRIILDDERTPLDRDLRRRRKRAAAVATGIELEVNHRNVIAIFRLRTRNSSTEEQQWHVGNDNDHPAAVRWKLDGDARWYWSALGELDGSGRRYAGQCLAQPRGPTALECGDQLVRLHLRHHAIDRDRDRRGCLGPTSCFHRRRGREALGNRLRLRLRLRKRRTRQRHRHSQAGTHSRQWKDHHCLTSCISPAGPFTAPELPRSRPSRGPRESKASSLAASSAARHTPGFRIHLRALRLRRERSLVSTTRYSPDARVLRARVVRIPAAR